MKKTVCFLLIFAIMLQMNVSAIALENTCLSDLSDEECVAFLENNGVEIPGTYNESMSWVPFIRAIIAKVEEDPTIQFAFGYSVALEFAYQIKSVVNAYYGFEDSLTYSLRSSNTLQDNTVYGTWSAEYDQYNCYAYAIDYFEYGKETTPGMIEWINNGNALEDFRYNWLANAYTVADWVVDDLESLGCIVTDFTSTLPATDISDHTHLICVRIDTDGELYYGFRDFHLMKLGDDGYWYHKPGRTNPLRYNYTPSNDRVWVTEGFDGADYFREETWTYDSDIWFIEYTTPHEWAGHAYYGPNQHLMTCTVCGVESLGDCEAGTPSYLGLNSHQSACALCGGLYPAESCTKEYVHSNDETLGDVHEEICTICNHVYTAQESCEFVYTDNEDGTHAAECVDCGTLYDINCDYQYTYTGDGVVQNTHTIECPDCDHSEVANCTFTYRYSGQVDGKNTHTYTCTACGHNRFGPTACTYKSSGLCRFCGVPQNFVPFNGVKEEILEA